MRTSRTSRESMPGRLYRKIGTGRWPRSAPCSRRRATRGHTRPRPTPSAPPWPPARGCARYRGPNPPRAIGRALLLGHGVGRWRSALRVRSPAPLLWTDVADPHLVGPALARLLRRLDVVKVTWPVVHGPRARVVRDVRLVLVLAAVLLPRGGHAHLGLGHAAAEVAHEPAVVLLRRHALARIGAPAVDVLALPDTSSSRGRPLSCSCSCSCLSSSPSASSASSAAHVGGADAGRRMHP